MRTLAVYISLLVTTGELYAWQPGLSRPLQFGRHLSASTSDVKETNSNTPKVPLSWNEMVRQVASAVKEASKRGQKRQIVRVLLPREGRSGDFGVSVEATKMDDMEGTVLVPPDESWQGGIMQLYRAASPTCAAIMGRIAENPESGLQPRVTEDRSVDESGVDGVGLFQTDDGSISCWLQPLQESVDEIVRRSKDGRNDQLVVLMNPQWRTVDDALDVVSKGDGFFSGLASFLGGKGAALRQLSEAGFSPVYTLEGYVCRGANVRFLQVLDSEWAVFCERDDGESFIPVGTTASRPSYQEIDNMLQESNIGYKYARDIGFEDKL